MFRGITGMCVRGVRLSLPLLRVLFLSLTCISKSPCNVLLQASVRLLLPLTFFYAVCHVCIYTFVHGYMYAYVFQCVLRTKVNIGYLPQLFTTLFFATVSVTKSGTH